MADNFVVSEIVTEFFLSTCQRQTLRTHAVHAVLHCGHAFNVHPPDDADANYIPLATGSVAEFCIEPMSMPINDIDMMYHLDTQLAIPRGHPLPTRLPAEFHNYVRVHEIIDSHLPGYVYLELRYLLTESGDDGNYNAVEYDRQPYTRNGIIPINSYKGAQTECHGPASCVRLHAMHDVDAVPCVRCLVWPPQAANWPTRHRNYGWPDSATLDRVVSNGCDLVGVAHRQCRQHKWMGQCQWRLSFSRAEIVLINSWMPVQQIVYHMLRYFMKTERLTDCADNTGAGTLSNYHIKTLMLWACELKSRSWWTENLNLVRICVELLRTLSVWLTDTRCPHYFVDNCNIIDDSFNLKQFVRILLSVDESRLSMWFVSNYIRKCPQFCPNYVRQLFDDIRTCNKLEDAVSEVVLWRLSIVQYNSGMAFSAAEIGIPLIVYKWSLNVQSCVTCIRQLKKIHSALSVYFTATAFLHVVYKIRSSSFSDELMDVLAAVLGQFIPARRHSNRCGSALSLGAAGKLMSLMTNQSSSSTVQMIEIELSKAYLFRALRCKDADSDSVYCLANVLLAVMHYITGQYQTAIDHCTAVTRSQDHSQCRSHVVQGKILPKISDDIDNALGLAVFYQHIRTVTLNEQQQAQYVSVFTTELVAHYLLLACLSGTNTGKLTQTSSATESRLYVKCIRNAQQLFITDVLLFMHANHLPEHELHSAWHKRQQLSADKLNHNTSELVELLQKSAVEHLTTYRQLVAQDVGSITRIVTSDFEALYAYKRGDYQRCLQLSTQNVHTLLDGESITIIPTYPEFIQLMDDDIASVIALTLLVYPDCRDPEFIAGMFQDKRYYACISQLTLSLYLMTQCQLKLGHSVTALKQTLDYVKVAQRRNRVEWTLNQLTLQLTRCKAVSRIATMQDP